MYHSVYRRPVTFLRDHAAHWSVPRETFRRLVGQLVEGEWIVPVKDARHGRLLVAWMPLEVEQRILDEFRRRLQARRYHGVTLMRVLLDLCIDDRRYDDDTTTEWLVTGDGSGSLELDRFYYEAGVAFEFQGAQPSRAGDVNSEADLIAQRTRDNVKAGLCTRNGVRLFEITAFDLSVTTLREKIGDALPWFPVFEDRSPVPRATPAVPPVCQCHRSTHPAGAGSTVSVAGRCRW